MKVCLQTIASIMMFIYELPSVACRRETGESRLYDDIIWTNNRYERPVYNKSKSIDVEIYFNMNSVSHFSESQQNLICSGGFIISWQDEFLTWDPTLYNETKEIRPPAAYVWMPGITASNSFQQVEPVGGDFAPLMIDYSGIVTWLPGDVFTIPCQVDIQHYPFDTLVCDIEIVPWSYSIEEVLIRPMKDLADTSEFTQSGQWSLMSTTIVHKPLVALGRTVSRLIIELNLSRQPINFVFSFILPVLMLSILGTFVFLIPSDSGEKISFAITIPLSYGVYMGFLTNLVPQTSNGISIFFVYLGTTLCLSALFVILSIGSVRLSNRNDACTPIPGWLQQFTRWVENMTCYRRTTGVSDMSHYSGESVEEMNEPKKQVTWKRVSRALDQIYFVVFMVGILTAVSCLVIYVGL